MSSFRFVFVMMIFAASAVLTTSSLVAQDTKENADFKLAVSLFNDKMYELSLEQFRQFVSQYPASAQSVEARYYAARTLRVLGRNDDARAAYQNFALTYPENPKAPDAWWAIGELYAKDKRFGDAASSFERIKVFHPKSRLAPLALSMAGRYFEAAGIQENATKSYLALLNDYPTSDQVPSAHASLGAIYVREGNYAAARKELQRAAEGGAGSELTGVVSLQLGKLALAESAASEAERLFKKVAAMSLPDSLRSTIVEARVLLGTIYLTSGRRAEAARVLEEATGDSAFVERASTEKSMMLLGQTYFAMQQYKRSADVLEIVLRVTSDSSVAASAAVGLGRAAAELKDNRRAISAFAQASAVAPTPEAKKFALLHAAKAAESGREFTAAARFLSQFIEMFPIDEATPSAVFHLAEVYRIFLKDYAKAIELYKELIAKFPRDGAVDDAQFALGKTYELDANLEEAYRAYNDLVTRFPSSSFVMQAKERMTELDQFRSAEKGRGSEELAKLIGDLILEKPKSELALRLGDIFLNFLHDPAQAAAQYQKVMETAPDSATREIAAFKRAQALVRVKDSTAAATRALLDFTLKYPASPFAEQAGYQFFQIQINSTDVQKREELARQYLDNHPSSPFKPAVLLSLAVWLSERDAIGESNNLLRQLIRSYGSTAEAAEATARLGMQLFKIGKSDTATVVFNDYLQFHPNDAYTAHILFDAGRLALQNDDDQEASERFELLRTKFYYTEQAPQAAEFLAQCYARLKQYPAAIKILNDRIRAYDSPLSFDESSKFRTIAVLADVYTARGDTAAARNYYGRYLDHEAESKTAAAIYQRLAGFEKNSGKIEAAVSALERSVAIDRNVSNSRELAGLYAAAHRYEPAIKEYRALLQSETLNTEDERSVRRALIVALLRAESRKDAEKEFAAYGKKYGRDDEAAAEFDLEKAMLLYRAEEFDAALALLQQLPAQFDSVSTLPDIHFWIGKTYEATNRADSAAVKYLYVVATYPRADILPKAYLALGNLHFFREAYSEAIKYYKLVVDAPQRSPEIVPFAMNNLLEAYKEVGLYDAALELLRSFIERYPNDESILNKKIDLGVLYQKLGYYDKSIVQLESLLESANKDLESEIRYYLGESYFDKGDYQQAILEFLKVPYLVTKKTKIDWTPNAFYMSAQSYEKLGRFDQAISMYQQIVDRPGVDPTFKTAAQKEINRVKDLMK